MEFITDSNRLSGHFKVMLSKYNHFMCTTAWAGNPDFDAEKSLSDYSHKIEMMVIGLHFYQTSIKFIDKYRSNNKVRFIFNTEGTYHPKVYLFYDDSASWTAFVGSSNFTSGGFGLNTEANIMITNNDIKNDMFSQISDFIKSQWNMATIMYDEDYDDYLKNYKGKSKLLETVGKPFIREDLTFTEFQSMSWKEYMANYNINSYSVHQRRSVLRMAHELFDSLVKTHRSFADLSKVDRCKIAGFPPSTVFKGTKYDWAYFGRMQRCSDFVKEIKEGNIVADALDKIPLYGAVTRKMYDNYCKAFYDIGFKKPIACMTRLLAIKRPDLFLCLDSKNQDELFDCVNITKSYIDADFYWDVICEQIWHSQWFKDKSEIKDPIEKEIKQYQVAMLDYIFYEEEGEVPIENLPSDYIRELKEYGISLQPHKSFLPQKLL